MKTPKNFISRSIFLLLLSCLIITSCTENNLLEQESNRSYNVSGKVEKGPFISGSVITIQTMDDKLELLGNMFNTTIIDNTGSFTFGSKEFQSSYAEMMATGYFFNEVKGELSNGTLSLRALVDLSNNNSVNVNVLTHLKYSRLKSLINSGKTFKEANTQAQFELLSQFGLQAYASKDVSQYSITSGTDESAALIAVSSLLLSNRNESNLTEYLSTISRQFGEQGEFSEAIKDTIKKDKLKLFKQISDVRNNIINRYTELGMEIKVKNLQPFFDWDNDGVAGNETLQEGESVVLGQTEINVPKIGGVYRILLDSPIPLYFENIMPDDSAIISEPSLYEEGATVIPRIDKSIQNEHLTINVDPSISRHNEVVTIDLYDVVGNIVASLKLNIEADTTAKIPLLSSESKGYLYSLLRSMSFGYADLNILEQYYHYNKLIHKIPLSVGDKNVYWAWDRYTTVNNSLSSFKDKDKRNLNVYQEHYDVFYAMSNYAMIQLWGDIPYSYGHLWNNAFNASRTPQNEILADLKLKLLQSINILDEKRYMTFNDINDLFFVSKDVARIALANIYMYEGNWDLAKDLLDTVIYNSYYILDGTSEYDKNGNGIIFALQIQNPITINIDPVTITVPQIIPIQSIADVYLLSAECEYHLGNTDEAQKRLSAVATAKDVMVSDDIMAGIKEIRIEKLLHHGSYFAFLKRNNLAIDDCGLENYQLLLPIPVDFIIYNPSIIQNPGYNRN